MAILIGAGIAAVGGIASSIIGSKAEKKAQAAQIALQREQLRIRQQERSDAFADRLPELKQLFGSLMSRFADFRSRGFGPEAVIDSIRGIQPAVDRVSEVIRDDIFGGGFLDRQLADQIAVNEAGVAKAEAIAQGLDEATSDAIAAERGESARQGFIGSSRAQKNALLRTRARGLGSIAETRGEAAVQSALGLQAVSNEDIQRLQTSLALPFQFTQNVSAQQALPFSLESDILQAELAPLQSFRGGPAANLDTIQFQPILGPSAGIAAGIQGAGGIIAQQAEARAIREENERNRANALAIAELNAGNPRRVGGTSVGTTAGF